MSDFSNKDYTVKDEKQSNPVLSETNNLNNQTKQESNLSNNDISTQGSFKK